MREAEPTTLTLSVLRCPDGVPPETRHVGGEFAIGRGTENDWVLPDPTRVVSKRHCVVTFRDGAWQVIDTSTNGTFLNHEMQRLGPDAPRVLRDGDRLIVGTYEIEVVLGDRTPAPLPASPGERDGNFEEERITGDPFPLLPGDPFAVALESLALPLGLGGIGSDREHLDPPLPVSDHLPILNEGFRAPRTSLDMLPADWDGDDPLSIRPPAAAPALAPETPAQPPPVEQLDAAPPAPTPPPVSGGAHGASTLNQALALILAGAEVNGAPTGDPAEALRGLGVALRAMVVGLRRLMIARAAVKGEFRIEQTMIRAVRNNPLKFSAGDDDALAALLGIGRICDMTASEAVSDALRDMRLHELAVSSAMLQAMREMLAELEPARLTERLPHEPLDGLSGRRKMRAWDAYEARHREIVRALADDFDSVFGKAFARAYERAMAEIAVTDKD